MRFIYLEHSCTKAQFIVFIKTKFAHKAIFIILMHPAVIYSWRGSQKIQSSSLNNSRMLGILAVTLVPTLFDIRNKTFKRSRLEFRHLLQNFSLSVTLDYNLLDLRREREVVSQTNIILKSNFLLFEVSVSQIDRYLALEIFTQYLCVEQ